MINQFKGFAILLSLSLAFASCLDTGAEDPFDPVAQFQLDTTLIEEYLEENEIVAEIDPIGGIRYVLHEPGTGESPTPEDTVTVTYRGKLLNDQQFDAGEDVTFPLRFTIIGWQIGMQYVKEGGSITLYIPSGQGYARSGSGEIPPNANLIFDVELHRVGED